MLYVKERPLKKWCIRHKFWRELCVENWKSRAPKKISNISRAGLLFYPSRGKSLPTAILKIFRHNASIYTNFNQIDRALRLSSNSIRITRSTKILCIPAVRDTYSSVCAFVFFDFVFVRFPLIKSFFFQCVAN